MTGDTPSVEVRPLRRTDRRAWERLWRGYLDFYDEAVPPDVTRVVLDRLTDPDWEAQLAWVAEVDGELCGFAHVGLQPSTWSAALDGYLEDLFVAPEARGDGVGRALLEHLVATGRAAGWRKVHWLTDTDNATARRLYDRLGQLQDQVRYTVDL